MFEMGHDASRRGGDNDLTMYSTSKWSSTGDVGTIANEFMGFQSRDQSGFLINHYPIIDNCNKAIGSIRSGNAQGKYIMQHHAYQKLYSIEHILIMVLIQFLEIFIFRQLAVRVCLQIIILCVLPQKLCIKNSLVI